MYRVLLARKEATGLGQDGTSQTRFYLGYLLFTTIRGNNIHRTITNYEIIGSKMYCYNTVIGFFLQLQHLLRMGGGGKVVRKVTLTHECVHILQK